MENSRFKVKTVAGIKAGTYVNNRPMVEGELATYRHYIKANPKEVYEWCEQQWGKHDSDWHWVALDINICIITVYTSEHSIWLKLRWNEWPSTGW